jgi:hypothetical protein
VTIYDSLTSESVARASSSVCAACDAATACEPSDGHSAEQQSDTCSAAQERCQICRAVVADVRAMNEPAGTLTDPAAALDFLDNVDALQGQLGSYGLLYSTQLSAVNGDIVALNKTKAAVAKNKTETGERKSRIELKRSIFEAYPVKIKSIMHDLNSNIAQTQLSTKDKVAIGVPFLPTFFSLRTHHYVVSLGCLTVLILALVVVMCFTSLLG